MQTPFINPQIDTSWYLQGRLIPPSCSEGAGCVLHLQTRLLSWVENHFHTGKLVVNPEASVEFVSSLLLPVDADLIRVSLDSREREHEVEYLAMVKLANPAGAIAFPTMTGLTIIIHNEDLEHLFHSNKCEDCKAHEGAAAIDVTAISATEEFDSLMEISSNETRSH